MPSAAWFTSAISCFFFSPDILHPWYPAMFWGGVSQLCQHTLVISLLSLLFSILRLPDSGVLGLQSHLGSLRTAFGTCWFLGLPCKLWLLRKHGLTNHSAVTSACLSLPPIHSCYPQWLTIAPFELPAKPQIELLLTSVQLDKPEEADIHSSTPVQNH